VQSSSGVTEEVEEVAAAKGQRSEVLLLTGTRTSYYEFEVRCFIRFCAMHSVSQ